MTAEKIPCPGECTNGEIVIDPVVPDIRLCPVCYGRGYFVTLDSWVPSISFDPEKKKKHFQDSFFVK